MIYVSVLDPGKSAWTSNIAALNMELAAETPNVDEAARSTTNHLYVSPNFIGFSLSSSPSTAAAGAQSTRKGEEGVPCPSDVEETIRE